MGDGQNGENIRNAANELMYQLFKKKIPGWIRALQLLSSWEKQKNRYKIDIFRCDGERETTDLLIFMLFYKGICSGLARNHEEMYTLYLYV